MMNEPILRNGPMMPFDAPFDYNPNMFAKRNIGWSMKGFYKAYTNNLGQSKLQFTGRLSGP